MRWLRRQFSCFHSLRVPRRFRTPCRLNGRARVSARSFTKMTRYAFCVARIAPNFIARFQKAPSMVTTVCHQSRFVPDLEALQGPDAFEAFSFSGIAAVVRVVGRNARSDTVILIEPRRSDVTSALSTKNSAANVHGTAKREGGSAASSAFSQVDSTVRYPVTARHGPWLLRDGAGAASDARRRPRQLMDVSPGTRHAGARVTQVSLSLDRGCRLGCRVRLLRRRRHDVLGE